MRCSAPCGTLQVHPCKLGRGIHAAHTRQSLSIPRSLVIKAYVKPTHCVGRVPYRWRGPVRCSAPCGTLQVHPCKLGRGIHAAHTRQSLSIPRSLVIKAYVKPTHCVGRVPYRWRGPVRCSAPCGTLQVHPCKLGRGIHAAHTRQSLSIPRSLVIKALVSYVSKLEFLMAVAYALSFMWAIASDLNKRIR